MSFLEKLNSLMAQKGLNNHSLSVQSGIPYTTIDGWYKKGYESAKLSTVKKLSDFFGVPLDYFVDGKSDIKNKTSANTEEIYIDSTIIKYAQLDEFGKRVVEAVTNIEYERCVSNTYTGLRVARSGKQTTEPLPIEYDPNDDSGSDLD